MSNVIPFPGAQAQQGRASQRPDPMHQLAQAFIGGMTPEQILSQIGGAPAQQARQIIGGKTPDQLRTIAQNMAAQRGVSLDAIAAQMGIRLPG